MQLGPSCPQSTLGSTRKRNMTASNKDLRLSNPALDRDRHPNRKVTQEDKWPAGWMLGSCKQKRPMMRLYECSMVAEITHLGEPHCAKAARDVIAERILRVPRSRHSKPIHQNSVEIRGLRPLIGLVSPGTEP